MFSSSLVDTDRNAPIAIHDSWLLSRLVARALGKRARVYRRVQRHHDRDSQAESGGVQVRQALALTRLWSLAQVCLRDRGSASDNLYKRLYSALYWRRRNGSAW